MKHETKVPPNLPTYYCILTFKVKQHAETDGHKAKASTHANNNLIETFCRNFQQPTLEDNRLAAQELVLVYHNVKHNLSYNSLDCNVKLLKHIFDSAKKLNLGRTKAETLVLNVLGVKAIEMVRDHLKTANIFFAIQIDASNVKNRKFFPIAVQYFDKKKGIVHKVINFLENADETAFGMFHTINDTLNSLNLSLDNVTCLSADNCNANFGSQMSLFTELKKRNSSLIKANCHAHIVHNAVRHVVEKLDYDVESLVLKIYAHFSLSAKRRECLLEFAEFTNIQYSELSRHVVTRWLSLNPSIEKILKLWEALFSYFRSMRDCPAHIKKLLYIKDEVYEDTPENSIPEIYLLFLNGYLKIFEDAVLLLEGNNISITELYNIFSGLLDKINQRLEQGFFGYVVMQKLKNLDTHKCNLIKNDFLNSYKVAKEYLLKWFDFGETGLPFIFSKFRLDHNITFDEISACVDKLPSTLNINRDAMFDELALLQKIYRICEKDDSFMRLSESDKWVHILGQTNDLVNVTNVVSIIFSIPCTTAYVERVFSLMTNKWTDTRNRASVNLIKSEICMSLNFDYSCTEFFNFVLGESDLLRLCFSKKKYESTSSGS